MDCNVEAKKIKYEFLIGVLAKYIEAQTQDKMNDEGNDQLARST